VAWWDGWFYSTQLDRIEQKVTKLVSQVDDLKAALDDVSAKVDAVGTEVQDLITKLQNLPPTPDLTAAIQQAQAIAAKLAAIPPEPA
jgi:outer membrane murein-binding lipoprotein Lpp